MQPYQPGPRRMRPPRRRERAREDRQQHFDHRAPEPWHYVGVEVWPPNPAGASYPMQLAEHHIAMTTDPRGFETLIRAGLNEGWFACLASHHRYKCVPAHPGTE